MKEQLEELKRMIENGFEDLENKVDERIDAVLQEVADRHETQGTHLASVFGDVRYDCQNIENRLKDLSDYITKNPERDESSTEEA